MYVFGICHTIGTTWKEWGCGTSSGNIWDLLDTILLPKEIAVVCCPFCTGDTTIISQGNVLTDAAAKATVRQLAVNILAVTSDKSSWPDVDHPEEL